MARLAAVYSCQLASSLFMLKPCWYIDSVKDACSAVAAPAGGAPPATAAASLAMRESMAEPPLKRVGVYSGRPVGSLPTEWWLLTLHCSASSATRRRREVDVDGSGGGVRPFSLYDCAVSFSFCRRVHRLW